jgi:hypothetical protein
MPGGMRQVFRTGVDALDFAGTAPRLRDLRDLR